MSTLTADATQSPLARTIATTATDIWNDSCAVDELEYAVAFGAVGATANPTIVHDVFSKDPVFWRGRIQALAAVDPAATEVEVAWAVVEEMSLRGAATPGADLRWRTVVARAGSRSRRTRPSSATPSGCSRRACTSIRSRRTSSSSSRLHRSGVDGDGGGDLSWCERQLHRQLQRRPGPRRGRGRRTRSPAAGARGPADEPTWAPSSRS